MNLFNSAVRFISDRKKTSEKQANLEAIDKNSSVVQDPSAELDFSIRNYAKESFSVLIVKPLSGCMLKILRGTSFIITGVLLGAVIALICCVVSLQFGTIENSMVSSIIINKKEKLF
jgi:hypothetical protein